MTSTTISRRAAFAGFAGVAVVAPFPALAVTAAQSAFQRLLADFQRLRADEIAYDTTVLEPMAEEYARRASLVPHVTATYDNVIGGEAQLTTDSLANLATAKRHTRDMKVGGWDKNDRFNQACRKIRAGDILRRRSLRRIRAELDADAIEVRSEQLGDLSYRAVWAAIECPVSTAVDLAAKVNLMDVEDKWECRSAVDTLVADAHRLAGEA